MGKFVNMPGMGLMGSIGETVGRSSGAMRAGMGRAGAFASEAGHVGMRVGKMGLGAGAIGGVGYLGYRYHERPGRSSGANGVQGHSSGGMQ